MALTFHTVILRCLCQLPFQVREWALIVRNDELIGNLVRWLVLINAGIRLLGRDVDLLLHLIWGIAHLFCLFVFFVNFDFFYDFSPQTHVGNRLWMVLWNPFVNSVLGLGIGEGRGRVLRIGLINYRFLLPLFANYVDLSVGRCARLDWARLVIHWLFRANCSLSIIILVSSSLVERVRNVNAARRELAIISIISSLHLVIRHADANLVHRLLTRVVRMLHQHIIGHQLSFPDLLVFLLVSRLCQVLIFYRTFRIVPHVEQRNITAWNILLFILWLLSSLTRLLLRGSLFLSNLSSYCISFLIRLGVWLLLHVFLGLC